jgi:nitrate reductase cytochrome c-type subunit
MMRRREMRRLVRLCAVAALLNYLMLPMLALADEAVPTEKEISQAEGMPPLIPHRIADADTAGDCLKCHGTGKKGAPVTPHPERKACTQCHVQGEVKAAKPAKRKR